MRKIYLSVISVFMMLCLFSCSMPSAEKISAENHLSEAFEKSAVINLDKLCSECTISRYGEGDWEVVFDSPNTLSGVSLKFCEGNVSASYKGLNFSVPKTAFPIKSMLLCLVEAVDTNARLEQISGIEKDGMIEISGSLEAGEYILTLNKDGSVHSFDMPNNLLSIRLTDKEAGNDGGSDEDVPE